MLSLRKAEIAASARTPISRAWAYLSAGSALALAGHIEAAREEVARGIAIFPYVSAACYRGTTTGTTNFEAQLDRVRQGLVLAGLQHYVPEDTAGVVRAPLDLPTQFAGLTPDKIAGAQVVRTSAVTKLLETQGVVVLDGESGMLSIPGAISLRWVGRGGSPDDDMQPELDRLLVRLTGGDKGRPIVALGMNAYNWPGYNLARRAAALGYRDVLWYRGGRDAWSAAGGRMEKPRTDSLLHIDDESEGLLTFVREGFPSPSIWDSRLEKETSLGSIGSQRRAMEQDSPPVAR